MVSPTPAIEVVDLTIRYGELVAVDGVSFDAAPGSILALLGPNGAGKTSTVEALEGYRRPESGTVRALGLDPIADHRRLTPRIGVMLQEGGVYTGIRPAEALALFASYYDEPAEPEALLDEVGLTDRADATWRHLSGGEKQRLSLALALVGRPEVVFLDEPTAGIDPVGRQLIRRVIAGLGARGVTVLLTTHDLEEAEKLADQVVIIDRGRVIVAGTPSELMTSGHAEEIRFRAAGGLDVGSLGATVGCPVEEVAPGDYRVAAAPTPATVAAITRWLADHDQPLGDLRAGRQSLEDVFLRLTGGTGPTPRPPAEAVPEQNGRRRGRTRGRRHP